MLKTVSSITNAIGALNYKGTWNASTNTPTIVSSTGTKGDYYVVSVAGSTAIDGISNWGVGDWIAFNGAVWQRVEGGADLNGVNLSVSGTTTLSGLTASTALALNASKEVVSVTNTGTGDNVLATSPTFTTDTTHSYLTASTAVGADASKKLVSLVQPAFSAYMNTGQALSAITSTKLEYNTEEFDTNSNYDPTTNYRFTPTVAGYYQINATFTGAASTSGDFQIAITKNGTAVSLAGFNSGVTGGFTNSPTTSVVLFLNGSTDFVEVFGYVAQAQTLQTGVNRSFNGCFLRGA